MSGAATADAEAECLTDDDAAGFAAGDLPAGRRHAIGAHVDACPACRRLVSALVAAALAWLERLPDAPRWLGDTRRALERTADPIPGSSRRPRDI